MRMTAEEILEHVRALPERERLRLVERVVHEVVESSSVPVATGSPPSPAPAERNDAIWAGASDDEFEAFMRSVRDGRAEPWRRTG